jgi:starch synthase
MADPDTSARFGAAGRKRAENVFSWEAIASQTIDLYSRLLER